MNRQMILIAHNIRSAHNVGSLLRTADGLGVKKVYLTGYTPYPRSENDSRLPHLAAKIDRQIAKTALGAENSADWQAETDLNKVVSGLRDSSYMILALEQSPKAVELSQFKPGMQTALLVGNEVDGLSYKDLELADNIVEIPMLGKKESLNVAIAAAIALYQLALK